MSDNESKFDLWWNSPQVKQKVGAAYSLGASVVIIGAMFKILHLSGAGTMLGVGMTVEAFLFALGIFDKPHKDYEWDKVYDFDGDGVKRVEPKGSQNANVGVVAAAVGTSRAVGLNYSETVNDDDVKKLSEGIRNLTATAQQFSSLADAVGPTDKFVKSIDGATEATAKFITSQESLNVATGSLSTSYQSISDGMETVEKETKAYAGKVESINKSLSSINSIYEIQLRNIQAQSEGLTEQTEHIQTVSEELNFITKDVQKMKTATSVAAEETERFKTGTTKLTAQITELNQVYGNMLNALSD